MDGTASNTVEISAVTATPIPEQHVRLNWKIDNIKRHLYFAERTTDEVFTVATLPFEIVKLHPFNLPASREGGPSLFGNADKVSFSWRVLHEYIKYEPPRDPIKTLPLDIEFSLTGGVPRKKVWLKKSAVSVQLLAHGDRGMLKGLKSHKLWPHLYIDYSIVIKSHDQKKRGDFKQSRLGLRLRELQDPEELKLWKCELFSPKEDLFSYVNEEGADGSLTIELKVSAYLHVTPTTVVHVGGEVDGEDKTAVKELLGEGKRPLGLVLGDKKTSDVVISLLNEDGKDIGGRFFCHSRILSAESSVFREIFQTNKKFVIENGLKVIEIRREISRWTCQQATTFKEAFGQFLAFLYTRKLKDEGKYPVEVPDWVVLLPELVNFAVAYDVKDLFEFCDTNFHVAAHAFAPSLALNIAKYRGLRQAEAKLREMFKDLGLNENDDDIITESSC